MAMIFGVFVSSLILGLFFFLVLILPELQKNHWIHKECFVTESSLIQDYCKCTTECGESSCREVYPSSPLCKTLIEKTYREKNLTRCSLGEQKYCADEGTFCDNGYYCCEWYQMDPFDPAGTWYCGREVQHQACRLHCPTCFSSRIAYTYEKWCSDGVCRNMTVIKDAHHGQDKKAAERVISEEPLGCRKDCWVNPNNSQEIRFNRGVHWFSIVVVCVFWAPAAILILMGVALVIFKSAEILINKWVDWRLRNALGQTESIDYGSRDERVPILRASSSSNDTGMEDPPPQYEV